MATLIDADALLDEVMDRYCEECDKRKGIKNGRFRIIYEIGDAPCRACEVDDMKTELEDAPTVDPVKHGRWIIDTKFGADVMSGEQMVICSVCGRGIFWGKQRYCPHCGAMMDEEDDRDDHL